MRVVIEIAREDIKTQYDNTVTTVEFTNKCIVVNARLVEESWCMSTGQTELHRVTVADAGIQVCNRLFFVVNQQVVNTIVFNACL